MRRNQEWEIPRTATTASGATANVTFTAYGWHFQPIERLPRNGTRPSSADSSVITLRPHEYRSLDGVKELSEGGSDAS